MNHLDSSVARRRSTCFGAAFALSVALIVLPFASGCGGGGRPPKELSPAEIPAAVETAFQGADPELVSMTSNLVAAVEAGEDSQAYLLLQTLLNRPDLTVEQRDVVSRSMISIGARLNEAAESGDAAATRLMETHGAFK
jgi:hypothetical protein